MLSWTAAVSSFCIGSLLSSSSGVDGGEWCFLLRGVACAARAVHVETMPSDQIRMKSVSGASVDWADGAVWSSGGSDVNQMG